MKLLLVAQVALLTAFTFLLPCRAHAESPPPTPAAHAEQTADLDEKCAELSARQATVPNEYEPSPLVVASGVGVLSSLLSVLVGYFGGMVWFVPAVFVALAVNVSVGDDLSYPITVAVFLSGPALLAVVAGAVISAEALHHLGWRWPAETRESSTALFATVLLASSTVLTTLAAVGGGVAGYLIAVPRDGTGADVGAQQMSGIVGAALGAVVGNGLGTAFGAAFLTMTIPAE